MYYAEYSQYFMMFLLFCCTLPYFYLIFLLSSFARVCFKLLY